MVCVSVRMCLCVCIFDSVCGPDDGVFKRLQVRNTVSEKCIFHLVKCRLRMPLSSLLLDNSS